jgi:hypothetical protein
VIDKKEVNPWERAIIHCDQLKMFRNMDMGDWDYGLMCLLKSKGAPILGAFYLVPDNDYEWQMNPLPEKDSIEYRWRLKR